MNDQGIERNGERNNPVKKGKKKVPEDQRRGHGVSQTEGQTTPDHEYSGATLLNSFISETIENAGNVLMTQKLETTQAMRSLSHTRDPTDPNYSRGTAANAEKATAEAFKNSSYIFTY